MKLNIQPKPFTGLNIGYDAKRLFQNFTGLGNYSRTLVENTKELYPENRYALFTPKVFYNNRTKEFIDYWIIKPNYTLNKLGWRSFGINKDIERLNIDVFHGLSAELPVGIKVPSVVTIHDLIFETHPQQYSFLDQKIYSAKAKYACQKANKIIAISETTKQDIIKFYSIDETKIEVIYQSCDEQFFKPIADKKLYEVKTKYTLPNEYLLYIGSVIERKNLFNIVKAIKQLGENTPPLIAIGNTNSKYAQQIIDYVKQNNLSKKVIFISPDFVDFPAIYKQATMFIYPSEYEGFGIPIIEAQAVGVPVITSNLSCLPEAAGSHSTLLNSLSPQSIATAIKTLLNNKKMRIEMITQGKVYVQQFKKEKVTKQLMTLYKSLAQ